MTDASDNKMTIPGKKKWWWLILLLLAATSTAAVTALLINIFERKQEGRNPFFRVVELTDDTEDPAVWGKNFPHQYDGYRRTVDQVRTRYGGSEALRRGPSGTDPRATTSQSRLEEDPRLRIMWAGYAFSKDFREERGHAYMLVDQEHTDRQKVTKQPGACIQCHASVYVAMKKLGNGDLSKGFDALNHMTYWEAHDQVKHPVACIDCHDPQTMALRVTRPAFMNGMRELKAYQGVKDYDVNRDATRQEMKSFVCNQCHVEYYFKGKEKTLTFPWASGNKADEILSYYEGQNPKHCDWMHPDTGACMLKAQHPETELFSQGIHARSGVACADCHMAAQRVGATKITDHHIRSPLLNINRACQTCHRFSESEMLSRAELIQSRTKELEDRAMDALVGLIGQLKQARQQPGCDPQTIVAAQSFHRRSQFLIDFIGAENSRGFHAPQEAARILGMALDEVRKGQLVIAHCVPSVPVH